IQDYKQFHGVHVFTPPPEGIVAVIGHNGAGKTTLFEAIEWCLYKPNSISAADVPTRGQAAKPRVKVVLLDPATGHRYVIIRSLKRGTASAEIYLEHDPESRIVEGSKQVTEHVGRDLIGLGHTAFVSTFFTRQKELSFFGTMKETERRREVGRLLGMETIREAQTQIADERTVVRTEAAGAKAAWEQESAGRDFAAELDLADAAIDANRARLTQAELGHSAATTAFKTARKRVEALRSEQQQDSELAKSIVAATTALQAARKRRDQTQLELTRLDRESERRASLVDEAARIPALLDAEQAHERDRAAHEKRARLTSQLDRAVANAERDGQSIVKAVRDSGVLGVPGWGFTNDDLARLPDSLESLIAAGEGVDAVQARQHAIALSHAIELDKRRAGYEERVLKYRNAVARLEQQRDHLRSKGDADEAIAVLERQRQGVLAQIERGAAQAQAANEQLAKIKPVADRLRQQQLGDVCPACQRPYTQEDLTVMLPLLERQIDEANCALDEIAGKRRAFEQQAKAIEPRLKEASDRAAEIKVLSGRVADDRSAIDTEDRGLHEAEAELQRHLDAASLASVPAAAEAAAAARDADQLGRVASALPVLRSLRESLQRHRDDREAAELDATAHQAARESLTEAQNAAAKIREIERSLESRPQYEHALASASAEIAAQSAAQAELETQRQQLGFDPRELEQAAAEERQRLRDEQIARDSKADAASKLTLTQRDRELLAADHQRISQLAEQAEAKGREADTLTMMYEEFNGFERFVAQRLAPALAESTGELLSAVTDGRYDSVNVTESYGIEVYDGHEECFPIEQFSGGERDVISLCARLALSRLIGG
ncbi:MAG: SMC family ATPase, partial [Rhizobiales bacterium]|nr:SMC family ATPase [Hyphomicrobiales bacterium]